MVSVPASAPAPAERAPALAPDCGYGRVALPRWGGRRRHPTPLRGPGRDLSGAGARRHGGRPASGHELRCGRPVTTMRVGVRVPCALGSAPPGLPSPPMPGGAPGAPGTPPHPRGVRPGDRVAARPGRRRPAQLAASLEREKCETDALPAHTNSAPGRRKARRMPRRQPYRTTPRNLLYAMCNFPRVAWTSGPRYAVRWYSDTAVGRARHGS